MLYCCLKSLMCYTEMQQVCHDKLQITLMLVRNGTQSFYQIIIITTTTTTTSYLFLVLLLPTSIAALLTVHSKNLNSKRKEEGPCSFLFFLKTPITFLIILLFLPTPGCLSDPGAVLK